MVLKKSHPAIIARFVSQDKRNKLHENCFKAKDIDDFWLLVWQNQRWSSWGRFWPRGQILKSLALASRPQVLENWPVLGLRTALFFELLKFCGALEKFFGKRFFCGDRLKNFCEDLFFFSLESTGACVLGPWPWPRAFLSLASRVSVLGKAVLGLGLGFFLCPWPWPWIRALCPPLHLWTEHYINENFTQKRKHLFWRAKQRAKELSYKYIWLNNGQIYGWKDKNYERILIKTDLDKL